MRFKCNLRVVCSCFGRQDVRDLVELTVDRMDVYHLVPCMNYSVSSVKTSKHFKTVSLEFLWNHSLFLSQVGALFLEFCIVLFCEGRVQAHTR